MGRTNKKKANNKSNSTWLASLVANPIFVFVVAVCSIIGLPLSIWSTSTVVRVVAIVILGIILILLISKFFSFTALKRTAVEEAREGYQRERDIMMDVFKSYNIYYKKIMADINDGSVISPDQLDNSLLRMSTYIEGLLHEILHETICVCIKLIETESAMNEDTSTWRLKTVARSQSTKGRRTKKDKQSVLVSENSDFQIIIAGVDTIHSNSFVVPNLKELIDTWERSGRKYENSTKRFLDDYKSTIVFPIRIETGSVSATIKERILSNYSATYHVVGFLCLDSQRTFENNVEVFSEAAELLESFADNLYPLLESYVVAQLLNIVSVSTVSAVDSELEVTDIQNEAVPVEL